MALASHDIITQKKRPRAVQRAMVLESRAGACAVLVRAIEADGGVVEVVRTPEEVGSGWDHHDLLVVEAGGRDESLRQLVKWARQTGSDPYVVALGDGLHDPGWLTGGRRGAHASMLEPDDGAAQLVMADARAWLATRNAGKPPVPMALRRPAEIPTRRPGLPEWLPFLLDKTSAAMAVFDASMRYRLCNRGWRELFGLHDAEVTGRSHLEVFPGLGDGWKEAYQRALGGESLKREEDAVVAASGAAMQVRWEISPWRDAEGAIGGVVAVFEPRAKTSGGSEHFEAGVGRSVLRAGTGWMVVQDPHGTILGSSKGFSGAVGRSGRMFGRSYWEAAKVEKTDFGLEAYRQAMTQWRESGEFAFPGSVEEILRGPGGTYAITWSLFPFYPESGQSHGIVRVGVPKLMDSPAPVRPGGLAAPMSRPAAGSQRETTSQAELPPIADWNLPWDEDVPVLLWEADASGVVSRVGEGLRRFAGITGKEVRHAEEFGRRIALTPAWFQKVNACLHGGLPVDETLDVKTDEGTRAVRFIGARAGENLLRGWAMTVPAGGTRESPSSGDALRLASAEAEKSMLRERLDQLVRALGEAKTLAPEPEKHATGFENIEDFLPVAVFVLDAAGHVIAANNQHEGVAGASVAPGEAFEDWLAGVAGVDEAGLGKWRSLGWRKQIPCTLRTVGQGGVEKMIELQSRLAGDGRMVVVARDVTDSQRALESLRAGEAKFRGFFHDAALAMVVINSTGEVVDANDALGECLGGNRREFIGGGIEAILDHSWDEVSSRLKAGETGFRASDGRPLRVSRLNRPESSLAGHLILVIEPGPSEPVGLALVPSAALPDGSAHALTAALRHRVNNDLQVLATLCSIDIGNPGPRTASLQRRLQVASLAYGATAAAAGVDDPTEAADFLRRVIALVIRETGAPVESIATSLEGFSLPASKFMLFGLAARELLDNALRHGQGPVAVASGCLGGSAWVEVTDHGPGLPGGFSVSQDAGLGLRIVQMACEELGGRLTWDHARGTCFRMVFPAGKLPDPMLPPA